MRSIGPGAALLAVGLALHGGAVCANPQGGTVRAGSAVVTSAGGKTEINQSSDRVIIDWQGFSIGASELTRFNQPSSSSAALNRVTGGDPSQILGQLQANGKILLINPNGILFGAGAKVDVAGLVATTANIANDDFMAKRLSFAQPGNPNAAVVNRGSISVKEGGLVALVAPGVANEGVITARLGKVALVSANRFTVDFHGDRLIQFAVDDKVMSQAVAADGTKLNAAMSNSGRIAANGGTVQMTANVARGVVDNVIDMSGKIEARAVRQVAGRIVLDGGDAGTVQVAGTLDASGKRAGQTGGRVEILGQHVGLFAGSRIDASGDAGGGTVLVGGNRQGQGPQRTAEATYVDKDAAIKADAISRGNGGEVVVWSNDSTNFRGTISARGGAAGGDGGQIETSSKNVLAANGRVDAAAPGGKAGQWLLDPFDLTITTASNNVSASPTFNATGGAATVDAGAVSSALNAGTSVTITTGASGGQPGNIAFASDGSITKTSANASTLTITAAGSMSVAGSPTISATGGASLDVAITVPNAGTLPGMSLNNGNLTVTSDGGHLFANNGISAKDVTVTMTSPHGIDLNGTNAISGTLTLNNISGSGNAITNTIALTLGTVSLTGATTTSTFSAPSITQTGALSQVAGTAVSLTATSGAISLTNAGNSIAGTLSVSTTAGQNASITNTVATDLGTTSVGGALTLSTAGAITQSGNLTVTGTSSFATDASAITLSNAGNSFTGAVSLSNSGTNAVQLRNGGATVLGTSSVGQNLAVTSGGTISQTGVLTVPGTTTLTATAANTDVQLAGQANNLTGAVSIGGTAANIRDFGLRTTIAAAPTPALGTLTNLRNLTLTYDAAPLSFGTINASGAIALSAGGAVSISGALALAGSATITGNGGISLAAVTGGGQAMTLNAGGSGDISLQTVGTSGAPLGALTIANARNVTSTSLIAVNTLTQNAGTGTTSLGGAGVSASGAVTLTTAAIDGVYNVGGFTVTSGQTIATGSIAGTAGGAAATLAASPGSTGTQTFNGCTIGTGCTSTPSTPTPTASPITPTVVTTLTSITNQVAGLASQRQGSSSDSNNSNVNGFVVQIPTQNVNWSNPSGDLRVRLAPEYEDLLEFFRGGRTSR